MDLEERWKVSGLAWWEEVSYCVKFAYIILSVSTISKFSDIWDLKEMTTVLTTAKVSIFYFLFVVYRISFRQSNLIRPLNFHNFLNLHFIFSFVRHQIFPFCQILLSLKTNNSMCYQMFQTLKYFPALISWNNFQFIWKQTHRTKGKIHRHRL